MAEINEGIIGSVMFYVDHGMLIIEDPVSVDRHDEWDPADEFVSIGPDSLYLSVQPSVDGPVEVVIAKLEISSERASYVYFDGILHSSSKYVVLHDANDVVRFSVQCPQGGMRVRVIVDRPGFVSHMVVMFLALNIDQE